MDLKVKYTKSSRVKIMFGIIGLLIILLIALFVFKWHGHKAINDSTQKASYNNYIYKIRYDFGAESYIYLLPDNVIKTVNVQEIYDIESNCNCMKPTGKFKYEENTINFSKETKANVIKVFDELYKKSGTKEFNADNIELSKYQQRVLLATTLNSEDHLTIESNLKHKTINKEFNSKSANYKIVNSKTLLDDSSKNKTVNKMAKYLNEIVNNDFDKINNSSLKVIENGNVFENQGVNLQLEFVYAGPYSLSFVYTAEGQLGTTTIHEKKGYTFKYTGDINEFDMNGWKDRYYNEALNIFMKTNLYIDYKDQLNKDWKTILYDNMYLTGNWYLSDDKIEFLIPAYLLGFDETTARVISIGVKVDQDF